MIGALVRRLLVRHPTIRTQITKKFCEDPPSPTDLLSGGGDPFYVVPFQFRNHTKFTIMFLFFFGIPFWAPPMIVHFQIYKRNL